MLEFNPSQPLESLSTPLQSNKAQRLARAFQLKAWPFDQISKISTCRVAPRIANSPLPVGVANEKAAAEELQVVARTRGSRDPRCTPRCVRAAINERRRCELPRTVVPGAVSKALAVRRDLDGTDRDGTGLSTKASMRVREIFACHFGLLLKRWCGYNGPSPF